MRTKNLLLIAIFLITIIIQLPGQEKIPPRLDEAPYQFQKQFYQTTYTPDNVVKEPGRYTRDDWADAIDNAWGTGLPMVEKLHIFDNFWITVDHDFACFQDLDVNWDSLRTVYRAEILDTVSRGRFAAIMTHLAMALKEAHTNCEDKYICNNTAPTPGLPLLFVGAWGNCRHFGAGLTPLEDSSLLVYKVIEDHPLELEPGDVVLGYDGVPWKELYPELIDAQLPIGGWWWGCSPSAFVHSWQISAGMNWHLFDTIDIVKYSTVDTIHLATAQLFGITKSIYCTEQMEISGVTMPDLNNNELFTYGIIDGTQIGYIYGLGWFWEAEQEFYEAVYALMYDYETTGMIIDFRLNYGGNMFLSNDALELLFNETVETIGFGFRNDTANHHGMQNGGTMTYKIFGDPESFYDKPIAVLTGPGAISSGDQVALRFKFHPNARFFGKSTTAAFNSPEVVDLGNSGWYSRYATADAFLASEPTVYITHDEFEVDAEVWHNKDDVAQGIDAVVQAAVEWIDSLTVSVEEQNFIVKDLKLSVYPNPFTDELNIIFLLEKSAHCKLEVYNAFGDRMGLLFEKSLAKGKHNMNWSSTHLPDGIYHIRLFAGNSVHTIKTLHFH